MKTTVSLYEFVDAFSNRPDNFSRDGLRALYDYLEDLGDSCESEIELDVIAFCCEYEEYEDIQEYNDNYGTDYEDIEPIHDDAQVIPIDDERFIVSTH